MKLKSIILIAVAILLFAAPAMAQFCSVGWNANRAPFTDSRFRFGGGSYQGKVVIFGGMSTYGTERGDTQIYDANTNIWSTGADMPAAKTNFGYAIVDGIAYAIAGYSEESYLSSSYAYDILADSWSTIADYPLEAAGIMCSDGGDGNLYCFGGNNEDGGIKAGYMYDPYENTWTPIRNMLNWMLYGAATYMNGRIYVMGGWQHAGMFYYKVADNVWSYTNPPYDNRTGPVMIAAGEVLWLTSGGYQWEALALFDFHWDIDEKWLLADTEIVKPRIYAIGGYVPGRGIYVMGGADTDSFTTTSNQLWQMCAPYFEMTDQVVTAPGDDIVVYGLDFAADAEAYLYDDAEEDFDLEEQVAIDSTEIDGTVPADLAEGLYGLAVAGDDQRLFMQPDAVLVKACDAEESAVDTSAADTGYTAASADVAMVQGYPLPSDPARLLAVRYRTFADYGLRNPMRLVVYYDSSAKSQPTTTTPVYRSDPLTLGGSDRWHTIFLHEDSELQDLVFAGGEFFVGFESTTAEEGPYLAFDEQASPDDNAWFYGGTWSAQTGGFLIRPTLEAVCQIGGSAYSAGQLNPANTCEMCYPETSLTSWTPLADGIACDDGLFCNGEDSCESGQCDDHTGDPCAEDETCVEDSDECVPTADDDTVVDDDTVIDDDTIADDDTAPDNDDDNDDTAPIGDDDDDDAIANDDDDDDDGCGC